MSPGLFRKTKRARINTQENYATLDSSAMYVPLDATMSFDLPEWREEEEQTFVHSGSWMPTESLDNSTYIVDCFLWMTLWQALWQRCNNMF